LEIGIIGLPSSGKTTIFNAMTRGHAAVAGYADKANVGVAKVPDVRLDELTKMYKPQKVVPAEVNYVDVPAPAEGLSKTRGISGQYLNDLQRVDALLIVVRAFEDESVVHVDESVDAFRDVENMMLELTFSDLELLERRLARLDDQFKGAKTVERDAMQKERTLLEQIKGQLEDGVAIREQTLTPDQVTQLQGFQFLTSKPLIVVVNAGEDQLDETDSLEKRLAEAASGDGVRTAVICGQLEMDLAQMEPGDEAEFRVSMGAGESGLGRMIQLSYEVVGLISFLTVGEDEVRAWEVREGTPAQQASGTIHSDLERGFIRAEVVSYDDLMSCGSLAEARKRGVLRQEGKEYIVKDGDIMHVLFNV